MMTCLLALTLLRTFSSIGSVCYCGCEKITSRYLHLKRIFALEDSLSLGVKAPLLRIHIVSQLLPQLFLLRLVHLCGLSRCIPKYASLVSPLEDAIKGLSGSQLITWSPDLLEFFNKAQISYNHHHSQELRPTDTHSGYFTLKQRSWCNPSFSKGRETFDFWVF